MAVPVVELNASQVLAVSALGVVLGHGLRRWFPVLDRLNIPASVLGGLVYAAVLMVLRDRLVNFRMDLALRELFMIAFFTCIGLGASFRLVRKGGPQVLLFFGLATLTVVLQNLLGVGLALALHLNPLLGLIAGSVTMTGGPGTALAFGRTFQEMGVEGAETVGLAAAMFGIVAGGLMGGFVGGRIIEKRRLASAAAAGGDGLAAVRRVAYDGRSREPEEFLAVGSEAQPEISRLANHFIVLAAAMGLGSVVSRGLTAAGLTLPPYVGAMIAAAIVRNIDDHYGKFGIDQRLLDSLGNLALNIFIVMALLTLELWTLTALALPMLTILLAQVALVYLVVRWVTFPVMGCDYDAAVMAGGHCGFGLGTTANALACMEVLASKYGPAPRAFLVIPLVGAFLIDFTNALLISTSADFVRQVLIK